MANLTPYLTLPGTAREALTFYQQVFGGDVELHTFKEFGRDDGDPQRGPMAFSAARCRFSPPTQV